MEAAGFVLSAAKTLLAVVQCPQLQHAFSMFGYEAELERLERTVGRIRAVLRDAERKLQELSDQDRDLVDKLRDAVYDADDLFDKFRTLAEQEQLHLLPNNSKVRRFFSRFGKSRVAYEMTSEVKAILGKLEEISSDADRFKIDVDNRCIARRGEDTCSYVYEKDIIGREDDVERVIDMLLNQDEGDLSLSVLSIVGMGGMGKTTLAQLLYNDQVRIGKEFPLRLWTCVGDQDQQRFDARTILGKILESATHAKDDGASLELVNARLREQLQGSKYLLVLDDVWTEKRSEWVKLEGYLKGFGVKGCRVLVTTRSEETAQAVGGGQKYMLKGLSNEASWRLFKMAAFGCEGERVDEYFEIGRDVVEKCAGVPLAIRVAGSLLFGQDIGKWRAFKEKGLACIKEKETGIAPILKLSYDHLDPPLKCCFSYCALFPKDRKIKKEKLIRLWMAQGYVEPLYQGQDVEDAGEDYFMILVRRCFFQDIEMDEYGEIEGCKMHDLMHDLALEAAGKEICIADYDTCSLDRRVRHVNNLYWFVDNGSSFSEGRRIRTYLCKRSYAFSIHREVSMLLAERMFLRALDLSRCGIRSLPNSIGKLLHLRYLDLSWNDELETLPGSMAKLHNLQNLDLSRCSTLRELPKGLSKLVNLRVLDLLACHSLTFMPPGIGKLTNLRRLSLFVAGQLEKGTGGMKQQDVIEELTELRALRYLKGRLRIKISDDFDHDVNKEEGNGRRGGYLRYTEGLTVVGIEWEGGGPYDRGDDDINMDGAMEALVEELQPHPNVREFWLHGYRGRGLVPSWARGDMLPNLVDIGLSSCHKLEELPRLAELPCLRRLRISGCHKLEYIESGDSSSTTHTSTSTSTPTPTSTCMPIGDISDGGPREEEAAAATTARRCMFFPSLQMLVLYDLPELKGWWKKRTTSGAAGDDDDGNSIAESLRDELTLTCLSTLHIINCPKLASCIPFSHTGLKLRWLSLSDVGSLKSIPMGVLSCLVDLEIRRDDKTESGLREYEGVFRACSSSLRRLTITLCSQLRTLAFGDDDDDDDDDDGAHSMPWNHTLCELNLLDLPKVSKLPQWIRHCTSLTRLWIYKCSPLLKERCQKPNGEDWPLIQHIPSISI